MIIHSIRIIQGANVYIIKPKSPIKIKEDLEKYRLKAKCRWWKVYGKVSIDLTYSTWK